MRFRYKENKPVVVIRTDANAEIGSGHAMRCLTIAEAIGRLGGTAAFVVSNAKSSAFFRDRGIKAACLEGNPLIFEEKDGLVLAQYCNERSAAGVLIDSYAVNDAFIQALHANLDTRCTTAYIDDDFTFEKGRKRIPTKFDLDLVINYSFYADKHLLESIYAETNTMVLVGPKYAPVKSRFVDNGRKVSGAIRKVLITTGATNPDNMLEKMLKGCLDVLPGAEIDVVVGDLAKFDTDVPANVRVFRRVQDLSSMMRASDIAISSAGTTLYELCASGLPSLAIALVSNQISNATGFSERGLGLSITTFDVSPEDISTCLQSIVFDKQAREIYSNNMRRVVDGRGAERIAKLLLQFGNMR